MKILKYAISIQWANGHHYFVGYESNKIEAYKKARGYIKDYYNNPENKGKKGAKPTAYIMQTIGSIK